jgi:autotransporter-associated beta strand protein
MFIKSVFVTALLALAATITVTAQPTQMPETVFNDNFSSSTLNTNSIPTGTPTASSTSYDIASGKNATFCTIAPGNLSIITSATTSGGTEAQAVFTANPVSLQAINDYIELDYTFIDSTDVLNSLCGAGVGPYCGLLDSFGSAPYSGGVLNNGGLANTLTTYDAAGTKNWVGYNAGMLYSTTNSSQSWSVGTRPAQTTLNQQNQAIIYNFVNGGTGVNHAPGINPFPVLTIGQAYTVQFRVTLTAANQLTVSNAMYLGTAVGGSIIFSNQGNFTGANFLTTNFDSLGVGYRAGDANSVMWTNDITSISVIAGLLANAGPYFNLTSSGNGCGGADIGLNGSVTTNTYYLYTNGVNSGVSLPGTGSSLDFGFQSFSANYTIVASNNATGNLGQMYGSQAIFTGTTAITSDPVSVTAVTNDPVSFGMTAVGPSSMTFQWYLNGVAVTNNSSVSGAATTSLSIYPAQAANAGSYYCVLRDPCGDILTTAPNAVLTLTPPHNLVWQGGSDSIWNLTEANFTNQSGVAEIFSNGDNVTFDNTSGNTIVNVTNTLYSTEATFNSSQAYTLTGAGKITGFSQIAVGGTGIVTIGNNNDYTGGTTISNGATLTLGTGTGNNGTLGGVITVNSGGILNYNYNNPSTQGTDPINNAFAGSGTVNIADQDNATLATSSIIVSSNFNGTINIQTGTSVHASGGNIGDPFGYGSTVYVPNNAQLWLDNSSLAYNMTIYINGTGWQNTQNSAPYTGALRIYSCTLTGPVILQSNARIGGTINGATIQSVISGPYQMEVYGNTNSYVLTLGPTNGSPQAYSSTLITSGAISCANTNAVSTGPIIEDAAGDFQLNGNNITVADLSSIDNSGSFYYPSWITGPTVRNNNATNAAVLTVGGDNSSQEYDGTFLNGAAASLGLTKVGSGTLALTAVNTNTGPVTVLGGTLQLTSGGHSSTQGAFTKAALLAVGSGAVLQDGVALTLNSGQTLAGNGTVSDGSVTLSSGSTINPGLPMGTLTVSGTVTMNSGSTFLADLNNGSSPNYSKVSASSITYAGTLAVTNTGGALHTGDTFQLFPSAVTTFSGFNLEAYDHVNNVNYTWNNNVASSGQISVATVASRLLALQTAPTASAIIYGHAISNSVISSGSVTNASGTVVVGAYAFTAPTTLATAVGTTNVSVTFTPTDTTDYNAFTFNLNVTVNSQTPLLKTAPTASTITNGSPLSASILTGGAITNAAGTNVAGTFAFTTPFATPGVGTAAQSVTFTPTDSVDYNSFAFNVNVTVVAGASVPTALKFLGSPTVSGNNLIITVTNTGAGTFYLLGSSNVASALNGWTPFWTNVAAGSGSSTDTVINAVNPASGGQFYILSTTNN